MIDLIKNSFTILNKDVKKVLMFSLMLNIASILASIIIPMSGIFLSLGMTLYSFQILRGYIEKGELDLEDLEEPNYKGILKGYLFQFLLCIPIIALFFSAFLLLISGFGKILFSQIIFESFFSLIKTIIVLFLVIGGYLSLGFLVINLAFPFSKIIFLDKDFENNTFWENIKISMRIARKYRFKIFISILLKYIFMLLSIFTLGLSLLYTMPYNVILTSNIYNLAKEDYISKLNV